MSYKTRQGKRICDPAHWFLAIKYDGMKGRWINGRLETRSGKPLEAPQWFLDKLPSEDIEGELWFGKNTFERTGGLRSVLRRTSSQSWETVKFMVFDMPNYDRRWMRRQEKLAQIGAHWDEKHPCRLVQWEEMGDRHEVERRFKQIIAEGHEGVILADPKGRYENGKVQQILKYKKSQDTEAVIIGYNVDDSKERLASFIVHPYENGTANTKITFNIGTGLTKAQRRGFSKKYPIGYIVSYTYELMGKNGKPRTPIFKGVRADM
jgi:DNA ligase-1